MIKFLDGPAAGVALELRYAPETLRAVRDSDGTWDALDAPLDQPTPTEQVFLYDRIGAAGFSHVDSVENGRRVARTFAIAEYRYAGGSA